MFARLQLLALSFVLVAAAATPASAQRNLTKIPPPDPEIERASFQLPEGFEVNLFAADPAIAKPIQMNFDAAGRLWIASSEVYPHIKPGQEQTDKILVLEDVDGDGVSDKTSVFADGLLIPTGVLPGDGGAYVANSTELLFLKDTDGDGQADHERVVLSGFGTEDTHHILHTFRWSPAGYLTFNQSIYIHSHIETPHGVRRLNGGGIWWFRPQTMRLEVLARGLINPWGNAWTEKGTLFATDGAGGEGINYVVPGAYYRTAVEAKRILQGLNPGSPKYCGLEIVDGRHLPDDWQGDLITHDFRGNRVSRFKVVKDGSGYRSIQQPDVITTKHVAFRPIDVKMGPDGAIYIADWYNPIIQHGEVDFRDERRDHVHGRIWRITAKGRPLVERPKLVDASVPELLDQLKAPESWTRRHARQQLKERGADAVLLELAKWVARLDDATEQDPHVERDRLNALWVANALREQNVTLLRACLAARDAEVRASALRLVGQWIVENDGGRDTSLKLLSLIGDRVNDPDPRVRLEAVRAIAQVDSPRAVEIALRALEHPVDGFLDYALWLTAWENRDDWVPKLATGEIDFEGNASHLTFALQAADSPQTVPALVKLFEKHPGANPTSITVGKLFTAIGGPNEQRLTYELVFREDLDDANRAELIHGLARAARTRNMSPRHRNVGPIVERFDDQRVVEATLHLAGAWRDRDAIEWLTEMAGDAKAPTENRTAALDSLAEIGGEKTAAEPANEALAGFVAGDADAGLRIRAAAGLVKSRPARGTKVAVALLQTLDGRVDPSPVFDAFLARKNGATMLVAELDGAKLDADVARLGLRAVSASGRPQPELDQALREAGGIKGGARKLPPEEVARLVARVREAGDPARGEAIFRRADLACLKCHAVGGAGGRVGPDLVSLGASAQPDYILESLLDPNAKVKENYHTVTVVTDEGKLLAGIVVRQSKSLLVIRDNQDQEIEIPTNTIEEKADGASIMPAGLIDKLTEAELVDLVRFLTELGKEGPYKVGREPVARVWQVMQPTPEAAYRLRRTSYDTAAGDDPAYTWDRRYATVGGALPLGDLPEIRVRNRSAPGEKGVAFARTELEVTGETRVAFELESEGLQVWLDGTPVEPSALERELGPGRHRITIAVDLQRRSSPVRLSLESANVPARFASGK